MKKRSLSLFISFLFASIAIGQSYFHLKQVEACVGAKVYKSSKRIYFSKIQKNVKQILISKKNDTQGLAQNQSSNTAQTTVYNATDYLGGMDSNPLVKTDQLDPGLYKVEIRYKKLTQKNCYFETPIAVPPHPCGLTCYYLKSDLQIFPTNPELYFPQNARSLKAWNWNNVYDEIYTNDQPIISNWTNGNEFANGLKIDVEEVGDLQNPIEQMFSIDNSLNGGARFKLVPPQNLPQTPTPIAFRTEVYTAQQVPVGTEQWISWSYRFGSEYKPVDPHDIVIFQSQPGTGFNPQISLRLASGEGDTPIGNIEIKTHPGGNAADLEEDTGIKPIANGVYDFIVHVIYGETGEGLFELWINGGLIGSWDISTVHCDAAYGGNLKWGLYHFNWDPIDGYDAAKAAVQSSIAAQVIEHEIFMSSPRIKTLSPGDPNYNNPDFVELMTPNPCEPQAFSGNKASAYAICPGSPCDDRNAETENDVYLFNGRCKGSRYFEAINGNINNDVEEIGGVMQLNNPIVPVSGTGILNLGENLVGLQFENLPDFYEEVDGMDVPNVIIHSAYIQFSSAATTPETGPTLLSINAAEPISPIANNGFAGNNVTLLSNRTYATSPVTWTINEPWGCFAGATNPDNANQCVGNLMPLINNCKGADGPLQRTPDLSGMLMELINNNQLTDRQLVLIFENELPFPFLMNPRTVFSAGQGRYEDSPKLVIKYYDLDDTSVIPRLAKEETKSNDFFAVQPNPAKDQFTLKFAKENKAPIQLNILNMNGQLIMKERIQATDLYRIDTSDWSAGMYFIQVQSGKDTFVQKLIKL